MSTSTFRLPSAAMVTGSVLVGLPPLLYTYTPRPPVSGSQFLAYPVMAGALVVVLVALLRERPIASREIIGWLLALVAYSVLIGASLLANAPLLRSSAPVELFRPAIYAIFLAYGYVVAHFVHSTTVTRGLIYAALAILAGQAILGATQIVGVPVFDIVYDAEKSHPFGRLMRVTGSLANPNAFAWMVAQAAVIVSLMHTGRTRGIWIGLGTLLVLLSGSRTFLLLFPFMIVTAQVLRDPTNIRTYLRYTAFGAGVFALFLGVIVFLGDYFPYLAQLRSIATSGSLASVNSFALRLDIWANGYEEFRAGGATALLLGLGARESTAILDNDFLYVLFRLGIVGTVVHFGIIVAALRAFLRARADPIGVFGAEYLLFALIFGMLSESTASWHLPLIMFALLGMVLGMKERCRPIHRHPAPPATRVAVTAG